jgi:signal transduction histidine kinase
VDARTAELQNINKALQESLETIQRAQEQLVQSEKMAALGSLVAGIAHEINTPIGVGVTAASHLEDQTREIMQQYHAQTMTRTALESYLQTATEIVKMLLANLRWAANLIQSFKQVAVDRTSEEKRRFRLKDYIDAVLVSLGPKLKRTPYTVTVQCPEDLEIESYPGAFSQIFTNFVMNSLDHAFSPDMPGEISVHIWKESGMLSIRYSDNGKGMSSQQCSRVFEPFYTTKRDQGGSGLGLNIVHNLVTQTLNGTIQCESQVGKGTAFLLRLPVT